MSRLSAFTFSIVCGGERRRYTFYAPTRSIALRYARAWAERTGRLLEEPR